MFNDDDLFGFGGMHRAMHRQFQEMDRMMNSMMDPFGMLGGMGMLEGPPPPSNYRQVARPFDPFRGLGNIFSEDLQERAMNDPNSHVYTQSTMVTFDGAGQPRIVENSVRKSGDVKETRRSLRDGAREEMSIGHTIGDRTHIIEKKRDKDGNVRRQQRFVNLDESAAEDFDREFQSRARANMGYSNNGRRALGDGAHGGYRHQDAGSSRNRDSAPIITLPEEDDEEEERNVRHASRAHRSEGGHSGPIIREISEEEAESSIPKRRRGFRGFFRANDA
ncbi:Myeloid leukemia factor [Trichostrongylus colubriformis]|uniref:Myeloid leukemia factor n=1 Tax=Trichostrongylus colubriformis TaxID=6319 RepID=A0AAN8FJP5_TRICO